MRIRVLIADDHTVVRQGLRMFLSDADLEIVGEARDGREAVDLVRRLMPDVVLMDLLMPNMDGIAATAAIRREAPNVEVIALTSVLEDASIVDALRAGAIGYLLKDTEAPQLRQAIRSAAAGQVLLSPKVAARMMHDVLPARIAPPTLTERETDVRRGVAAGLSNKEIAHNLSIGEQTVKTHVAHILDKLGVVSRTQAAMAAVRLGLVPLPWPEAATENGFPAAGPGEIV